MSAADGRIREETPGPGDALVAEPAESGRHGVGGASESRRMRLLAREDPDFPEPLRVIPSPPSFLYVRGRLVPEDGLAVAIVGSRHATPYGIEVAERLAADLASRGVTVVSGLARGVDSAAHRGALEAGGRTIAVLGSGVDVIYPPEHRRLAALIEESGAVVSQFPPGTPPLAQHFPIRNRVIAGLSLGVVIVEATDRSGSLITAGLAADLGREVMAVPGRVTSPESRGAHLLIQDGAALVADWEDVVAQLPMAWRARVTTTAPVALEGSREGMAAEREPDVERGRLLELIGDEAVSIDDVIERSGLASGRAAALLMALELDGLVRQFAGKRFVRLRRD